MLRDLLPFMLRKPWEPDQALQQQHLARGRGLFSEQQLHTLESSLGGEGLYGWHSEQEGDPSGGGSPLNFGSILLYRRMTVIAGTKTIEGFLARLRCDLWRRGILFPCGRRATFPAPFACFRQGHGNGSRRGLSGLPRLLRFRHRCSG